jgi:HK97 gp10 family phage protein
MGFNIKETVTGLQGVLKNLAGLKNAAQRRVLRKAMDKASQPMTKTAKALAPVESRLYKKSIGRKVKTYPSGVVVVLIGARTGFKTKVRIKGNRVYRIIRGRRVRIRTPKPEMLEMLRNPTKYSHLIEFGTSKSAAVPHLRPAFQQHRAQFVQDATRVVMEEIAKLAKAAAKGK